MSTETQVTEFDDGSKIVTTTETEFVEPGEASEVLSEAVAEAVEPVADAAVQIAEIEAGRDIALAEINAEARVAEAEAYSEAVAEERDESQWRQNIETQLAETNSQLQEVKEVLSTLVRSEQSEANPSQNPEPEPESVVVTPDSPEQAAESAPEPPKRPRKSRWI